MSDRRKDGSEVAEQRSQSTQGQNRNPNQQSRSASRRARRHRLKEEVDAGKYPKTASLDALEEADKSGELSEMRAFERLGPDSVSMDGPVTKARAMRGEIPMRGPNANKQQQQPPAKPEKASKSLDEQEGLKLKVEANLEIEIELKASIRGDLTLSLL